MPTPKTSFHLWIDSDKKRDKAVTIVSQAALPFAMDLKRDTRTGKQNKRQWAMLNIISKNCEWHGQKLCSDDWKIIFLAALHKEMRIVPNMDNDGFVTLGRSSSSLTVQEHCDLTALIEAFAAKNGIEIQQPNGAQGVKKVA